MPAIISKQELKNINSQLVKDKKFVQETKKIVESEFREIHKTFLNKFDAHPVTMEINNGAQSTNISGTLGGVGNLFTYIGFSSGAQPISTLRLILQRYDIRYSTEAQSIKITIEVPTKEEVFRATPLPWATGRSWARGIERGLSGFGHYLVKNTRISKSKSGFAIQTNAPVRAGRFSNTPYMSSLLNDYYKEIQKLERKRF